MTGPAVATHKSLPGRYTADDGAGQWRRYRHFAHGVRWKRRVTLGTNAMAHVTVARAARSHLRSILRCRRRDGRKRVRQDRISFLRRPVADSWSPSTIVAKSHRRSRLRKRRSRDGM